MLSNKKIICPNNLINVAKKMGTVEAAIVNPGEIFLSNVFFEQTKCVQWFHGNL